MDYGRHCFPCFLLFFLLPDLQPFHLTQAHSPAPMHVCRDTIVNDRMLFRSALPFSFPLSPIVLCNRPAHMPQFFPLPRSCRRRCISVVCVQEVPRSMPPVVPVFWSRRTKVYIQLALSAVKHFVALFCITGLAPFLPPCIISRLYFPSLFFVLTLKLVLPSILTSRMKPHAFLPTEMWGLGPSYQEVMRITSFPRSHTRLNEGPSQFLHLQFREKLSQFDISNGPPER